METTTKRRMTRRGILGKGISAAVATVGLGALARSGSTLAKPKRPPIKRDPSSEYTMIVFYDKKGNPIKVCYYDQNGKLLYCDSL